jgi:DNA polymerase sigma
MGRKNLLAAQEMEDVHLLGLISPSCCLLILSFMSARKGVTVGWVLVVWWWLFVESSLSVVYYYNLLMIIRIEKKRHT